MIVLPSLQYEIRAEIRRNLLANYQVAERMGISISTFYQRMQRHMDEADAKPYFDAIHELVEERERALRGW